MPKWTKQSIVDQLLQNIHKLVTQTTDAMKTDTSEWLLRCEWMIGKALSWWQVRATLSSPLSLKMSSSQYFYPDTWCSDWPLKAFTTKPRFVGILMKTKCKCWHLFFLIQNDRMFIIINGYFVLRALACLDSRKSRLRAKTTHPEIIFCNDSC